MQAIQESTTSANPGSITINVNGEVVDTINDAHIAALPAPAMLSEQEQESMSQTFDALLNDMSPHAPTASDLTSSPDAPSLSYFEESMSAGSPTEELPSPDFAAFNGACDFDLSFDGSDLKLDSKNLFDESELMFPELANEMVNLDSFTLTNDLIST